MQLAEQDEVEKFIKEESGDKAKCNLGLKYGFERAKLKNDKAKGLEIPISSPSIGDIIQDVENRGKEKKNNPGPKYYGMTWNSEEFKPVEIETCWQ